MRVQVHHVLQQQLAPVLPRYLSFAGKREKSRLPQLCCQNVKLCHTNAAPLRLLRWL